MAGNPANLQVRAAFGTQEAGPTSAWHDMRVRSESLGLELPTIEDDSIEPLSEQPEGLESKIEVGGDLQVNHMPEDHHILYADFMGGGTTPAESPTGVYTQILSNRETDEVYGPLFVEVDRDLGQPNLYIEQQVQQLTFSVSPRGVLNGAATLLGPRYQTWEAATVLSVTATPTAPKLRGYHLYADLGAADANVFIRVDSFSSPNVTIETKIGAAAAYSNTQVVPLNMWTTLEDEAGAVIGDEGVPVQVYLTGSYTAADEWRIDRERALWTPTLPTHSPLNEVYCYVYVDGSVFRLRDFSTTATRPLISDEVIGGRFTDDVLERGQRTVSGELTRLASDLSLINRLKRAESFALRLDAFGALIGATGVKRRVSLVMLNCKPSGRTPSVSNRTTFDEALSFTAHASGDGTYPAPLNIEVVNSIADIAA